MYRIKHFWNWLIYYRRGKIKYYVYDYVDTFKCMATNGKVAVCNCYGSTPEKAKEMALYRLNKALNEEPVDLELVLEGNGYQLYRKEQAPLD